MRGAQLKNRSWLLYLIIIFLYSCEDNDDKISANLPELKKTFIMRLRLILGERNISVWDGIILWEIICILVSIRQIFMSGK